MKALIKSLLPVIIVSFLSLRQQKHRKSKISKQIVEILKLNEKIFIEIGSGPKKGTNGWITSDIQPGCDIQMNLLEKLPFPDNSVDLIYSSHFLEHFQTKEIKSILQECYRILKPGGKLSTCVPNAFLYIDAYMRNIDLDESVWIVYSPAADINSKIDYINYIGHLNGEHKHMFDIENLISIQKYCGFKDVSQRQFDPALDMKQRDYQSIYSEAIK